VGRALVGAVSVELDAHVVSELVNFLEEGAEEVRLEPKPDVAVGGAEPQNGAVERQKLDGREPHIEVLRRYPRSKSPDGFVPK
jgi:hypothetical protein